ncbi:MAG: hypothetical protein LC670_09470, partial [Flavobacteriales bacterium]|nr:hypothetical protein [Flavobacteriales bacterium]
KYGVPTKGMISWQTQLRPKEMAQVTSYIKTLEGTTPAAPKEPQGELYTAPDETGDGETDESNQVEGEKSGGEDDDTKEDGAENPSATAAMQ